MAAVMVKGTRKLGGYFFSDERYMKKYPELSS